MNNISYELHERIKNIDSIYEYPKDLEFHLLKKPVFDWPTAKDGNFFNILRVLTIRGKISLSALASSFTDGDHPYDSAYQTLYRLLNGAKNSNISLQERGIVNKNGRLFELSSLGILYAIHVFHMNRYYDKEHTQFSKTNNFSYQKDINGIFDILKKHTTHFPLFFDNLEYIKTSKDLDINVFFDIIDFDNRFGRPIYNYNPFSELDFSSQLEHMIPFIFYHSVLMFQSVRKKEIIKLEGPVASKVSEISSSILRKMKEDYEFYKNLDSDLF